MIATKIAYAMIVACTASSFGRSLAFVCKGVTHVCGSAKCLSSTALKASFTAGNPFFNSFLAVENLKGKRKTTKLQVSHLDTIKTMSTTTAHSAKNISSRMAKLLVDQANRELDSSRMYLAMSLWFQFHDFTGSAKWCRAHSMEEREHALRIFDHLAMRNTGQYCDVTTSVLKEHSMSDFDVNKVSEIWRNALKQEMENSAEYWKMMKVANEEDDFITKRLLDLYMDEQLLEENALDHILSQAVKTEQTGGLYTVFDQQIETMEH